MILALRPKGLRSWEPYLVDFNEWVVATAVQTHIAKERGVRYHVLDHRIKKVRRGKVLLEIFNKKSGAIEATYWLQEVPTEIGQPLLGIDLDD